MAVPKKESVCGHWMHSFEEDSIDQIVYRPRSFDFPRSRGRRSFDLQPDGKIFDVSPGKADLPDTITGNWELEREQLVFHHSDGTDECLMIKEITPEKLVIRKN